MALKRKLSDCEPLFAKKVKTVAVASRLSRSRSVPARLKSFPAGRVATRRNGPSHLEARAEKRKLFDGEVGRKTQEQEAMKREDILSHAMRETDFIKEIRKNLLFKAQPIHHYQVLCVRRSERRLTEPRSPSLLTAKRAELHELVRDW